MKQKDIDQPESDEAYYMLREMFESESSIFSSLKEMFESEGKVYVTSFIALFDKIYGAGNCKWYYPNMPKWSIHAYHVENIQAAVTKLAKDFDMSLTLDMSKQIVYVTDTYDHYEAPFINAIYDENSDALDIIYTEFLVYGEMFISKFLPYFYKAYGLSNYKLPKDKHFKQNVQTAVNMVSDEDYFRAMTLSINFADNTISAVL
jgi:hypothetical protein